MTKTKAPLLLLGINPKRKSVVKDALIAAEKLLDSVKYVAVPGDTTKVLALLRKAMDEVGAGK